MWSGLAAEAYDRALPLGSSFGDIEFYRHRLKGPCLEPMCGSGRFLVPLFDEGLEIDGFDLSAEMIARARANAARFDLAPRLEVADATTFDLGRQYASIVVPISSFMMLDHGQQCAALRRFHAHLRLGGRLWLDVHTPPFPAATLDRQLGDIMLHSTPESIDPTDQISTQVETLTRVGEIASVVRKFHWRTPAQMRVILRQAGFSQMRTRDRPPFTVWEARRG